MGKRFCLLLLLCPGLAARADGASLEATFAAIFAAEAGRWRGDCVIRDAASVSSIAADFRISWDERGHRFEGRYGETPIAGSSRIEDGHRLDLLDGAPAPSRARIVSARFDAADDYRYVVVDEQADPPRRSTITRLGERQINLTETDDAARRPLRLCVYRRGD